MNPANTEPGPSGRKRRGGGSTDDAVISIASCSPGGVGEDSDGSWEDADSSDEHTLTIDEPKKKKARTKKTNSIQIPENILAECRNLVSLDRNLDLKAKKNNMTSKQVKLVLKSIFSSPELLSLLRKAGLATVPKNKEALPSAEPKMTRAMTKTLTEAGDVVPWIVNPATPAKEPAPEILSLVTEEFPEEEEEALDPEYRPELEQPLSDEDESLLMSDLSEFGTPRTNATESTVNTPNSALRSTPGTVLAAFKKPMAGTPRGSQALRNLQFDNSGWEGYGTRSRRSLNSVNIEELEQMFVPFDITPDMYDIPCDNDDYAEFLKTLYAGQNQSLQDSFNGEDDPTDPEYSFQPDEEDIQLRDPEELRNDKATKISKKEVAELMAELLECANRDMNTEENKQKSKKRKSSQPPTPLPPSHQEEGDRGGASASNDRSRSTMKQTAERVQHQHKQEEDEGGDWLSDNQRQVLAIQVQQHIQLLTQMSLLSSHNPKLSSVNNQCSTMMSEMFNKSLLTFNSVLGQSNLLPSMSLIEKWKKNGSDATILFSQRRNNLKKRKAIPTLTPQVVDFMSGSDVFYFPRLLPVSGLVPDVVGRLVWTEGEDQLLGHALERLIPGAARHKIHMADIAFTIHTRYMQAKTPQTIKTRLKNLKASVSPNPVREVLQTGKAPALKRLDEVPGSGGLTLTQMVASGRRDDIPDIYLFQILKKFRREQHRRFVPIEPKEEVTVEPDLPLEYAKPHTLVKEEQEDEEEEDEGDEDEHGEGQEEEDHEEPGPSIDRRQPSVIKDSSSPRLVKQSLLKRRPLRMLLPAIQQSCKLVTITPLCATLTPPSGPIVCLDGNSTTPGSLSDSDTPAPTRQKQSTPPRPPPTAPTTASPFKSYLASSSSAFAKSPLKAASDRILRKYTSPLKKRHSLREVVRRRPMFNAAKAAAITPRRIVAPAAKSGTPPCSATPPPVPRRGLGSSPALVSPREEEQDTPTAGGRRKTRHQKEAEVTLSLLGPLETEEEKEARENRECMEMYSEIQRVMNSSSEEVRAKYQEIISKAGQSGVAATYQELNKLLEGHPTVQDLLLDLLSCEEAASLGTEVYQAHAQRIKMKRFLLKLGIAYKHQPAYHVKVLKELDSLCKENSLTPDTVKAVASRLFRHSQHLLDEFLMLVPGGETPEAMLPSPEELSYPEDSEGSWEGLDEERVNLPRSPPEDKAAAPNIRFINGEVFVVEGKNLKPAIVEKRPL